MDISVTDFKQRCLEIIRDVEQTGRPVVLTRRGKVVARSETVMGPIAASDRACLPSLGQMPRLWVGVCLRKPSQSVLRDEDFEALR